MSGVDDVATEVDPRSAPTERMAFTLRVMEGPDAGATLTVESNDPTRVLVGKSSACHLVLHDPRVSRRHLALEIAGVQLRVSDLGSTNRTTVNGIEVTEAALEGGEVIRVGDVLLHVERHPARSASRITNAVNFGRVIGASVAMRRLYPVFELLAASAIPIVIEGEAGTGKELLAEELHSQGPRRAGPFVVYDAAATHPDAAETSLFGDGTSPGLFDAADGGTLLVDEAAELPAALQIHLLRKIDQMAAAAGPRVIATTRRDLEKEVEAGRFREDLYLRLAVGRIELPPLRRRFGDDSLLASFFCKRMGEQSGSARALPPDFLRRHEGYAWPGNIRELESAVARRLELGNLDELEDDAPEDAPAGAFDWILAEDLPFTRARDIALSEFERSYVERVLQQHGGNVSRAAAASGLARRYFQVLRARGKR